MELTGERKRNQRGDTTLRRTERDKGYALMSWFHGSSRALVTTRRCCACGILRSSSQDPSDQYPSAAHKNACRSRQKWLFAECLKADASNASRQREYHAASQVPGRPSCGPAPATPSISKISKHVLPVKDAKEASIRHVLHATISNNAPPRHTIASSLRYVPAVGKHMAGTIC